MSVHNEVFILLGSNLGDSRDIFHVAKTKIEELCGKIVRKSALYESEPWGFTAKNWFLNQVVQIETTISPDMLMDILLDIEKQLGRERIGKEYHSRTLDLDILYYDSEVIDNEKVTLPHPRLHLRKFTLLPLCEIAPDFVHPVFGKTQKELLEIVDDKLQIRFFEK